MNLSSSGFRSIREHLIRTARPLERALFYYRFEGGPSEAILDALASFRNPDGGFGRALEPDFRLPDSSPMATSAGFRILDRLPPHPDRDRRIAEAVAYLETAFDAARGGWPSVPGSVNEHPHAPWWHWDAAEGGTPIDRYWGNPSAELIAYLLRHRRFLRSLDPDVLAERAISELEIRETFGSPHELYCYTRLHRALDPERAARLAVALRKGVAEQADLEPSHWTDYVPSPLKFTTEDSDELFGIPRSAVDAHLDFLADTMEREGRMAPNWSWGSFPEAWEVSKAEWTGILTLEALTWLDWFGRIEGRRVRK